MAFTTVPFQLSELRRDWIVGTSGPAFQKRVQRRIAAIEAVKESRKRGVLIAMEDPVAFAACFLAAVYLRVPVILANPNWRRVEWDAVAASVNPALVLGKSPLDLSYDRKIARLPVGSILIPTGGSTGGVRFAVHDWKTLSSAWEGLENFIGPGPMNACCVLPLFHVSGLMQLLRTFISEGQLAFWDFKQLQLGRFPPLKFKVCVYPWFRRSCSGS